MASQSLGEAVLELRTDGSALDSGFSSARNKAMAFGEDLKSIGTKLSIAVTAPIALGFKSMFNSFDAQAVGVAKVEALLRSTGGAAGFSSQELQKMASGLQDITRFGDEVILNDVTAQLLTFTNIADEQFTGAQVAALNLATVLDGDLKSASIQLGKALNDPVANLGALSRSGIQFSDEQTEVIKMLAETNQLAKAQDMILGELATQYGAVAEEVAKVGAGPWVQFKNSLGDVGEDLGKIIAEGLNPLIPYLKDAVAWMQNLDPETKKLGVQIAAMAGVIGPAVFIVGSLVTAIAAIETPILAVFGVAGVIGTAIAGIAAFGESNTEAGKLIDTVWTEVKKFTDETMIALEDLYNAAAQAGAAIWNTYGAEITAIFRATWAVVEGVFTLFWEQAKAIVTGGIQIVTGLLQGFTGLITGDWETLSTGLQTIWSGLWTAIEGTLTAPFKAIDASIGEFTGGVGDYFQALYDRVIGHSSVPDLLDGIRDEFGRLPNVMTLKAQTETELTSGLFGTLETDVTQDLGNLATSVSQSFSGLGGAMTTPAETETGKVATAFSDMKADVDKSLNGLASSLKGLFSGEGIGGLADSLGGIFAGGFNADSLKSLGLNFAKNAVGSIPVVGPLLQELFDPISNAVGNLFGKGRKAADSLVPTENAFWQGLTKFMPSDQLDALGALPFDQAKKAGEALKAHNQEYMDAVNAFAQGGSNEAKVAEQSFGNTQPHVNAWLEALRGPVVAAGEIPQFEKGTDYVTRDTLAYIHKGEAVIPADENRAGREPAVYLTLNFHDGVFADDSTMAKLTQAISRAVRNDGLTLVASETL